MGFSTALQGLKPDTPLRIIETRGGILLLPQNGAPISEELARELEEWQSLRTQTWDLFPCEDPEA